MGHVHLPSRCSHLLASPLSQWQPPSPSRQGHILAAVFVGGIYFWGQGVAIDYPRAMAADKVGGEGGHASCQWQVGAMYCKGLGVDVDYTQALPWIEKAAAQDQPSAVSRLGGMYGNGEGGVTPSWRRAREYNKRAIGLGSSKAAKNTQDLTKAIQIVTSHQSHHSTRSLLVRDLTFPHTPPQS